MSKYNVLYIVYVNHLVAAQHCTTITRVVKN